MCRCGTASQSVPPPTLWWCQLQRMRAKTSMWVAGRLGAFGVETMKSSCGEKRAVTRRIDDGVCIPIVKPASSRWDGEAKRAWQPGKLVGFVACGEWKMENAGWPQKGQRSHGGLLGPADPPQTKSGWSAGVQFGEMVLQKVFLLCLNPWRPTSVRLLPFAITSSAPPFPSWACIFQANLYGTVHHTPSSTLCSPCLEVV